ncbi:MAG: hydroxymethylglutaryl-CoA lyase [Marmoricola sp.]
MTTGLLEVIETGPRDGLQNEKTHLPTEAKIELVDRAITAGIRRVEVTSFVSPKAVPALADADEVFAAVARRPGVRLSALVANERGFGRAVAAGVDELDFVLLASDTFSQRNQGISSREALALVPTLVSAAHESGAQATVTIGAAFGCPFEGEVALERVLDLAGSLVAFGVDEVSFADTIGAGTPDRVRAYIEAMGGPSAEVGLRFHFHNTRNTGYANALAALEMGVGALDATTGGIGGCPFAPDATGNIATEDLWYLAQRMGYASDIDIERILDTARWTGTALGSVVPGQLSRAGVFGSSAAAS